MSPARNNDRTLRLAREHPIIAATVERAVVRGCDVSPHARRASRPGCRPASRSGSSRTTRGAPLGLRAAFAPGVPEGPGLHPRLVARHHTGRSGQAVQTAGVAAEGVRIGRKRACLHRGRALAKEGRSLLPDDGPLSAPQPGGWQRSPTSADRASPTPTIVQNLPSVPSPWTRLPNARRVLDAHGVLRTQRGYRRGPLAPQRAARRWYCGR